MEKITRTNSNFKVDIDEDAHSLSLFRVTGFDVRKYTTTTFENPFETISTLLSLCAENGFLSLNPRSHFGLYVYDQNGKVLHQFYLSKKGFELFCYRIQCKWIRNGKDEIVEVTVRP